MATQEPILLMTLSTGKEVRCTEYDCVPELVQKFGCGFNATWRLIPDAVRGILERHWGESLVVSLRWGSHDWAKPNFGFAASDTDGKGLFCWSVVLKDIPQTVLVTTIVHEIGHMAFIAVGEPGHAAKKNKEAEYLIAELLKEWGLNQEEADLWLIENFNDYESPIARRDEPLRKEQLARRREQHEAKMQQNAQARQEYRARVREFFDRVAGSPPATSANLKQAE